MKIGVLSRRPTLYSTRQLVHAARERDYEKVTLIRITLQRALELQSWQRWRRRVSPVIYAVGLPVDQFQSSGGQMLVPRMAGARSPSYQSFTVSAHFLMCGVWRWYSNASAFA